MNKERVLNIAKALRESPHPEHFTMDAYYVCGTPGCAFGHYTARIDLQSAFAFRLGRNAGSATLIDVETNSIIDHTNNKVREHFGLSESQITQLFGCCGEAKEASEENDVSESCFLALSVSNNESAARWIEKFAAETC